MSNKVGVQELALAIAKRREMSASEAERFVEQMFEVLSSGLLKEQIVKIKGLGTFKITDVNDRESVHVNTGERIVIKRHGKLSFVPDGSMRDLVNAPFLHFETVEINDGVTFDSFDDKKSEEKEREEQQLEQKEARKPHKETDNQEDEKQQETVQQPLLHPKNDREEEHAKLLAENELLSDGLKRNKLKNRYLMFVCCLLLLALGGTSFFLAKKYYELEKNISAIASKEAKKQDNRVDSKKVIIKPNRALDKKSDNKIQDVPKEDMTNNGLQPDTKYNEDVRVKTGAYEIVGIDFTVKVQQGQTLKSISRAHLGEGMECYVEAVNDGMKTVSVGQEVKIPKLKIKRKKK